MVPAINPFGKRLNVSSCRSRFARRNRVTGPKFRGIGLAGCSIATRLASAVQMNFRHCAFPRDSSDCILFSANTFLTRDPATCSRI